MARAAVPGKNPAARCPCTRTVVTIAAAPQPDPGYPRERTVLSAMPRLMSEDWQKMTKEANVSPMRVASRERWFRQAKAANLFLEDEEAAPEIEFVGDPETPTRIIDAQASHSPTPEPWQTWGSALRYLIYRIAQATPTALLLWATCIRHR